MNDQPPEKIEFAREVTESTSDHHYHDGQVVVVDDVRDRTPLAIVSVILALPFPILITALWIAMSAIKGSGQPIGEFTMNTVFLYLVQFFVVPVTTLTSVIMAMIVTTKAKDRAAKISYMTFGIVIVGIILMVLFLESTK